MFVSCISYHDLCPLATDRMENIPHFFSPFLGKLLWPMPFVSGGPPHNLPLWGRWHGVSRDGRGKTGSSFSLFRRLWRHLLVVTKSVISLFRRSPSSAPSGHLPPRGKVLAWAKLKPSPLGKVDCPKGKTEEDNAVRSEDNSAKQEPKSPRLSPGALKTYSLFRCRLHHHPQIFHHLI